MFLFCSHKDNVILMGSPGCGKTTIGRILGEKLGLPVADIDDNHLEPFWGTSVAKKVLPKLLCQTFDFKTVSYKMCHFCKNSMSAYLISIRVHS